ncbi:putative C2H2-like zinc finger protein [Hibiscus syriacus]|uniref:Protein transport protein sec16 n=1 Tax=Hibiscus syriacus TaxID=106335 RepID=A0A6A2XE80_HIBSY|nr:protein transport protein SEC16A homolog [Hibiscus syriacus]XP_039048029.1 protein transport protein SEC16A homolog [Hibiscus syriacus]KAE8660436.1 putative C2H2-like zinc finger protein [Hibiscus syriacus]
MASPPFEVEDQLDEDFFDKLVNDDDNFDFSGSTHKHVVEAADSEEVKAFSNLIINKTSPSGIESGGKDVDIGTGDEKRVEDADFLALLGADEGNVAANESSSLVSSNANLIICETSPSGVESGEKDVDIGTEAQKGVEDADISALLDANVGNVATNKSSSLIPSTAKECSVTGMGEEGVLDSGSCKTDIASGTGVKEVQWSSFDSDSNVHYSGGSRPFSEIFNDLGDNSEDPFSEVGNKDDMVKEFDATVGVSENTFSDLASSSHPQNNDGQYYGMGLEQNVDGQDFSSYQYWENLYPGWKYDPNSGQWYQVEGYLNTVMNSQERFGVTHSDSGYLISDGKMDAQSLQQTNQSAAGTFSEDFGNSDTSNWNWNSQGNADYPAHMVFDPQYPGWYYDTIALEWKMLESYTPTVEQSTIMNNDWLYQNKNIESDEFQALGSQDFYMNQCESAGNYHQQFSNSFQDYSVWKSETGFSSETKQLGNIYSPADHVDNHADQQNGFEPSRSVDPYKQQTQTFLPGGEISRFDSFIPAQSYTPFNNQTTVQPEQHMQFTPAFIDAQKSGNHSQKPLQIGTSFSSSPIEGRSSAGRHPHALVTFGFGGKLVVMSNNNLFHTSATYGNQGSVGGVISVLNLVEVVTDNSNASSFGFGAQDYFQSLCQQPLPGPLVGGNVGNKELYKWIDERIAHCESSSVGYRGEVLRLLFSLLKISCQYYGKLRSPFGTDQTLKESDYPELAITKHLGSVKGKGVQSGSHSAVVHCLQNLPSEAQIQATALEVQSLLVSGRKKEALEFAREGQLWGPALVIASQLGDQLYGDTVKLMALKQLKAGSPLRTLCLVVAGQPADVFSTVSSGRDLPGYVNTPNQPGQVAANMLDGWEENLAIITANRTKDDELVIIHLGDCLWKERSEAAAAHICYLIAEANFEPYSDGARLCLIGADHWNCPRTYASPEAIQRTELYEYSKVLGNSQFLLLPFQPYKLIYAYMLAEVGKMADSLKYCQAILKSLRTGRTSEVETWKQLVSSLEERLRIHQQGGYYTNLAPTKLVGKLLTFFDNTARVVGGQPPPLPSTSHSSVHQNEFTHQPRALNTSDSQPTMLMQPLSSSSSEESTMAMTSLMPSASMEPISQRTSQTDLPAMASRSISEPYFGQSDRKVNSSSEANSSVKQEKTAVSSGPSRFGRFGSQLFQKTVGLVLRSRPDRQAKLGEENKFYYDEKLKRWVEEGAEPPAEETALPPPPTSSTFLNGVNDPSVKDTPQTKSFHASSENKSSNSSERSSGIPPIPPSSNLYSARARMGVRSRYVDTFNKGGGSPVNFFQSPVPSAKPMAGSSPKFFVPSMVTPAEDMVQNTGESIQEVVMSNESPATSYKQDLPPPTTTSMQRFPSMDAIVHKSVAAASDGNSRRIASWSGSLSNGSNLSTTWNEIKPPQEALRIPHTDPSSGEDLQEIKF